MSIETNTVEISLSKFQQANSVYFDKYKEIHSNGGFLSISTTNLKVIDSIFIDSYSLYGGAIYFHGKKPVIINIFRNLF